MPRPHTHNIYHPWLWVNALNTRSIQRSTAKKQDSDFSSSNTELNIYNCSFSPLRVFYWAKLSYFYGVCHPRAQTLNQTRLNKWLLNTTNDCLVLVLWYCGLCTVKSSFLEFLGDKLQICVPTMFYITTWCWDNVWLKEFPIIIMSENVTHSKHTYKDHTWIILYIICCKQHLKHFSQPTIFITSSLHSPFEHQPHPALTLTFLLFSIIFLHYNA